MMCLILRRNSISRTQRNKPLCLIFQSKIYEALTIQNEVSDLLLGVTNLFMKIYQLTIKNGGSKPHTLYYPEII